MSKKDELVTVSTICPQCGNQITFSGYKGFCDVIFCRNCGIGIPVYDKNGPDIEPKRNAPDPDKLRVKVLNNQKQTNMEKKMITEAMHLEKEWFEKASKIETIDQLVAFAKELFDNYQHDYGTCVHAVSALAIAGAWYGAHKEGITGFQAGFVMWDFIRHWNHEGNQCGFRLLDFDDLLFPQYADHFEKRISADMWKRVQEVAKEKLAQNKDGMVHPAVWEHWQSIAAGTLPFGFVIKED